MDKCPDCGKQGNKEKLEVVGFSKEIIIFDCECSSKREEEAAKKEKEERKDRERIFAGIPPRYKNCRFSNLDLSTNRAIYDKAFEWTAEIKNGTTTNGLFFFGTFGTGKTHLLYSIANELLGYKTIQCFTLPVLLEEIRSSFNDDKIENPLRRLMPVEFKADEKDIDILFLDDIGKEKSSEWVREQLYMLINYRYNRLLPMVLTSNVNAKELNENLGQAITSRIHEMCEIMTFKGKDRRL